MKFTKLAAIPIAALALAACESQAEQEADVAEDRMEAQAEQSAAQAGPEEAALGMTEAQLLDADLVGENGEDLGDVEYVSRNAMGTVDGLLVELDDTDRYVMVPLRNLVSQPDGDDMDVRTTQSAQQLAELPDASMPGAPATTDAM